MGENKDYITYEQELGSINISEEVLAVIAGGAALDVDGVACLYASPGRDIAEFLGKKNPARGVRIHVEEKQVTADIYIMAAFGSAVNEVGAAVQKAVATAVESTTGLTVVSVNVHICGISMKKDK